MLPLGEVLSFSYECSCEYSIVRRKDGVFIGQATETIPYLRYLLYGVHTKYPYSVLGTCFGG